MQVGTIIGVRGKSAKTCQVRWQDGREERVRIDPATDGFAAEGSALLDWLLDPASLARRFAEDSEAVLVDLIKSSYGEPLSMAAMKKTLTGLGLSEAEFKKVLETVPALIAITVISSLVWGPLFVPVPFAIAVLSFQAYWLWRALMTGTHAFKGYRLLQKHKKIDWRERHGDHTAGGQGALAWDEVPSVDPADFTLVTMPKRVAEVGDRHAAIDQHAGSIEQLLELSGRHEREGLGDAPWPPHYRKQPGEPARVQPSKRRVSKHPLIEIGRAKQKEVALEGLERWKTRHPEAASHLEPADILVDSMRGRSSTWTRIRVNLQHVPTELRPDQEPLDPDEKTWSNS